MSLDWKLMRMYYSLYLINFLSFLKSLSYFLFILFLKTTEEYKLEDGGTVVEPVYKIEVPANRFYTLSILSFRAY